MYWLAAELDNFSFMPLLINVSVPSVAEAADVDLTSASLGTREKSKYP